MSVVENQYKAVLTGFLNRLLGLFSSVKPKYRRYIKNMSEKIVSTPTQDKTLKTKKESFH
jgi:hypothetical protein